MAKSMKNNVAVVIPYYHSELTELESISFRNCCTILKKYQIILVLPEKIPRRKYPTEENLLYEQVPDEWMESVDSYNQMMLSKDFYRRFKQYEFILIFQLDAFVFSDCLEQFCDYGYDYIGAPWLNGMKYLRTIEGDGVWYVGNGGFSLRKVAAFLHILEGEITNCIDTNEDAFWASHNSDQFHVAPMDVALKFSFERDVRRCFKLNSNELPFGCHAWEKYDFAFWKPIFEQMGYYITVSVSVGNDTKEEYVNTRMSHLKADSTSVKLSLSKLLKSEKSIIYIFGTGTIGKECVWLLKHNGINRIRCVDNNPNIWGNNIWGTVIESPEIIAKMNNVDDFLIIIATIYSREDILYQLELQGYQYGNNIVFYDDLVKSIQEKQMLINEI